jgi:DNA repair protein RadC
LLARVLAGGRAAPRSRRAAERLLAARGLEAWVRLDPEACLSEALRLGGESPAARVLPAVCELARRALGPAPGVELARPEDVVPWLAEWREARREHFVAFDLNARHQLIARRLVSVGSLSASIVHPREVFQPAVAASAAGLIVAHNHPSGDPEPSPEDVAVTRRLREAGELLGIELVDHVVVAGRGYVSLKARGCI